MSFTSDIYLAINEDINSKAISKDKSVAIRLVTYPNDIKVAFAINTNDRLKSVFLSIDSKNKDFSFPKWKGVNIGMAKLNDYDDKNDYVVLSELPNGESYIFEIVVEDLRRNVEKISNEDTFEIIVTVLAKWRNFFQYDGEILLSDIKQQGLMGELLFLEFCISNIGKHSIAKWAGWNDETHDFYFNDHAVEVKTTTTKEPYKVHISSENQLDNNDISGNLFLEFFAFRKSINSGITLPEEVEKIRQLLFDSPLLLDKFTEHLNKYGYHDEVSDLYTTGYFVRDNYHYEVTDEFPCIVKSMLPTGIANVDYSVSLSSCNSFLIETNRLLNTIDGGKKNA